MNKIYRRLWSTARQCWVVASELTSTRGKRAQTVRCGAALAAALAASPLTAGAAEGAVSEDELHWWQRQTLSAFQPKAVYSSSIGTTAVHRMDVYNNTTAAKWSLITAAETMAVGAEAQAGGEESIAVGIRSKAASTNSVAVGNRAETYGSHAVALGFGSRAHSVGSVSLGNASRSEGRNSMALGSGSYALGSGAIAIGGDTKAYNGSGVAIGADARAGVDDKGDKSTASGAVAIGALTRSGNGGVATGLRASAIGDRAVALGNDANAAATHATATGYKATASASQATAIGREASASGVYSTALGNLASASGQSAVALGDRAVAAHAGSVALGNGSQTTAANQISVGNGTLKRKIVNVADGALSTSSAEAVTGKQLNATNVEVASVRTTATSAQRAATAAKTAADSALGKANVLSGLVSQVSATGNVRLGGENSGTVLDVRNKSNASRKLTGVADATLNTSSTEAVSGKQLNATNVEVASVRTTATSAQTTANAAKTTADSALDKADVLGGLVGQVSATGNVRLGGENTGTVLDVRNKSNASRKLTGVADATLSTTSTDAVSGKQLNATNVEVASVRTTATSAQTTANAAKTTADNALGKANVLGGLVGQVSATSNVRLGGENTGTVLDVRNKSNANRKLTGVADATLSTSSTEAVSGKQLNATNVEVASVRTTATSAQTTANAAKTTADSALGKADVLSGLVSQVSATGNVRLGGENTGTVLDVRNKSNASRKLTGVADATLNASSTEAVTGKQLFGVDQKVTANQSLLASHATELAGHETRIADNRRDLDDLRTEFDNFDPDLEGVVRYAADGSIDMDGGKVRGVAAGDISSAGSTDAVNGGQLFVTNRRIDELADSAKYLAFGEFLDQEPAAAGRFAIALGDSAQASTSRNSEGAVALGAYAVAEGTNSVALGRAAHVHEGAARAFALGAESQVAEPGGIALGAASSVLKGAVESVAIGAQSVAKESNSVSFGNDGLKRRLVNVARGRDEHDATTAAQLSDALATLGGGAGLDAGGDIVSPSYNVQGETFNTVGDALTSLDGAVVTAATRVDRVESQLRSVFQDGPGTRSDGLGQLNLAGANGMVLGNVANGLIAPGSRDAVNGGQLHAMEQRLDGRIDGLEQRVDATPEGRALASASAPTPPAAPEAEGPAGASGDPTAASAGRAGGGIASADGGGTPAPADAPAPTPQVDTAELEKMLARANEYTDGAISNFERRLDKMDKRFNRMAAMSSAQTAMAMNTAGLATYNRLGAGVGYAEGESAMAVGYQRVLNDKGSATFSLNGAFTNSGERSMGVGVGIGW